MLLRFHPCCCMHQSISFYCLIVFHYIEMPQSIYSPVDGHLSSSQFVANLSKMAMTIHKSLCGHNFSFFFRQIPTRGIVGYNKLMFNIIRRCQPVLLLEHFTLPPVFYEFLLLHILANIVVLGLLNFSYYRMLHVVSGFLSSALLISGTR